MVATTSTQVDSTVIHTKMEVWIAPKDYAHDGLVGIVVDDGGVAWGGRSPSPMPREWGGGSGKGNDARVSSTFPHTHVQGKEQELCCASWRSDDKGRCTVPTEEDDGKAHCSHVCHSCLAVVMGYSVDWFNFYSLK